MTTPVDEREFAPFGHPSPMLDHLGDLRRHRHDPSRFGFDVDELKLNGGQLLHAWAVSTIADVVIIANVAVPTASRRPIRMGVTATSIQSPWRAEPHEVNVERCGDEPIRWRSRWDDRLRAGPPGVVVCRRRSNLEGVQMFDRVPARLAPDDDRCTAAAPRQAARSMRSSRLTVGAVDDTAEHEADRIADQVVGQLRSPTTFSPTGRIARSSVRPSADVDGAPRRPAGAPGRIRAATAGADDVVRRQYAQDSYRLKPAQTRQIHVEPGVHQAPGHPVPIPMPARAILYETMVRQVDGRALAQRFRIATAAYPRTAGLTVALNKPYRTANELTAGKQLLTQTAAGMVAEAPGRINVVKVLWQDGRGDPANEAIRGEVPFAELRRHAAADAGSRALYAALATQATTTWRRMGDDDMPFSNPNDDQLEVNQQLAKREGDDLGSLVSFSYDLTSASNDPRIQALCSKVYKHEAATVTEVRETLGLKTYAIEPTTFYRGPGNEDVGAVAWNRYEAHADPNYKQIKEGASFAKALRGERVIPHEYVELDVPMPTSAGGRLDRFVAMLLRYMNSPNAVDGAAFMLEAEDELARIDQSVWDYESLTRGSRWMGDDTDQDTVRAVNEIIGRHMTRLLVELFADVREEQRKG